MKVVIQRVKEASVVSDGIETGRIGHGLVLLLGIHAEDTEEDALLLAEKISKLRIFTDDADKMNLSLKDVDGEVLVVSNFTLEADYAHGNRPSFINAARPAVALPLYLFFLEEMKKRVRHVGTGVFGADMQIALLADGPITIVMQSSVLKRGKSS